jgi:hypothetical protein
VHSYNSLYFMNSASKTKSSGSSFSGEVENSPVREIRLTAHGFSFFIRREEKGGRGKGGRPGLKGKCNNWGGVRGEKGGMINNISLQAPPLCLWVCGRM